MTKTHKKRIQLWIDALRSGEYKQVRGRLGKGTKKSMGYCCLGVACEVAIANGVDVARGREKQEICYDGITDVLPISVCGWYGFGEDDDNPVLDTYTGETCSGANDNKKRSFSTIADMIEARFLMAKKKAGKRA